VKKILLGVNAFPAGTTALFDESFENSASDSASYLFRNQDDGFDANHRIEYYNTFFLAWQAYKYNHKIFREDKYSGPWISPSREIFTSQVASQYNFACANDAVLGNQCILIARYGRYFVFFRSSVTQKFAVMDIAPLLQEIDARISPCISK